MKNKNELTVETVVEKKKYGFLLNLLNIAFGVIVLYLLLEHYQDNIGRLEKLICIFAILGSPLYNAIFHIFNVKYSYFSIAIQMILSCVILGNLYYF
jgi:hypothetical protein